MDLQLESVGSSWIVLHWQPHPLSKNATTYTILVRGRDSEQNVTGEGSSTRLNVTGLQPGTVYTLRVIAVFFDGKLSPPSIALVAATSVPGQMHDVPV